MSIPYLGSRISLISKSGIRYEGILYTIDPAKGQVALQNVRSFGTEGRRQDGQEIPPSPTVYEYIIFRGSDINDLQVCEDPAVPPAGARPPEDPAIISRGPNPYGYPTSGYPANRMSEVHAYRTPTKARTKRVRHKVPSTPQLRDVQGGTSENARNSTPKRRSRVTKTQATPAPMYAVSRSRVESPSVRSDTRPRADALSRSHGTSLANRGNRPDGSAIWGKRKSGAHLISGEIDELGSAEKKKRRMSLSTIFTPSDLPHASAALISQPLPSPQSTKCLSPLALDLSQLPPRGVAEVDDAAVEGCEDEEWGANAGFVIPATKEEAEQREAEVRSMHGKRTSLLKKAERMRKSLSSRADLRKSLSGRVDLMGGGDDYNRDYEADEAHNQFLTALKRNEFALTKTLLSVCNDTDSKQIIEALAASYAPAKTSDILELLKELVCEEVMATRDVNTLFRGGSPAMRLVSPLFRLLGGDFESRVLCPTITEIEENDGLLQVNPDRVELSSAQGQLGAAEQARIKEDEARLAGNRVAQLTGDLLSRIIASVAFVPEGVRAVLMVAAAAVEAKFPEMLHRSIGGLFFLRWLCPLLTQPFKLNESYTELKNSTRKNLVLISKLIQNISNGVDFGEKEGHMVRFNSLHVDYADKLCVLFDKLLTGRAETLQFLIDSDDHTPLGPEYTSAVQALANFYATYMDVIAYSMEDSDERALRELLPKLDGKAVHPLRHAAVHKILESPRKAARRSSLGVTTLMASPRSKASKGKRRRGAEAIIDSRTEEFQRPRPRHCQPHPDTPRPNKVARVSVAVRPQQKSRRRER